MGSGVQGFPRNVVVRDLGFRVCGFALWAWRLGFEVMQAWGVGAVQGLGLRFRG